jgi:hypothetical protein
MLEELDDQRKAIVAAMEGAVPEEFRAEAEDVLEVYREDRIGLTLLQEFYSYPPEAREDWVREIRVINRQHGIFLLAVITPQETYQYLVSSEGIEFQGRLSDGFLADELLDFFGYDSAEAFETVAAGLETLPVYEPLQLDEDICPACHAVAGEYHELGCPVEICPWCGGQLISCDCRYEKLGLDAISSEEELRQFEEMLEEQGRIPYSREQRPSFADEGPNSVFD